MPSFQVKGFDLLRDLPLVAGMPLQLAYLSVLLRRHQFGDVVALIDRSCGGSGQQGTESPVRAGEEKVAELDKVYRAATFFLKGIWRSKRPCLRRALVTYRWCRKQGIEAEIVIGVKKSGDELASHAWLVIDGEPYRESREHLSDYRPILGSRDGEREPDK
ncbi:MAG: lasso peptide biosynthesis B2 protein [Bacillota bacterium]